MLVIHLGLVIYLVLVTHLGLVIHLVVVIHLVLVTHLGLVLHLVVVRHLGLVRHVGLVIYLTELYLGKQIRVKATSGTCIADERG